MKTDMTSTQAIILYTTIEALCNQFDRDNEKGAGHDGQRR